MTIVIFCSGSAGDILPFISLGSALVARGHSVHLVTHSGYACYAAQAGLNYEPFDTSRQYDEFLQSAALLNSPAGLGRFLSQYSLPFADAALRLIRQCADGNSLLITSPTFDTVPRMAIESLGLAAMWLFMAPVQVEKWAQQRALRTALYRDVLGAEIDRARAISGMRPVQDWDRWLRYSDQSMGQWPSWFAEPDEGWLPEVEPVGFFVNRFGKDPALPSEVKRILESLDRKPILLTGGTGRYMVDRFFSVSLEAAASLQHPVIVVTRYQDLLPRHLPANTLVVERLPFASLMPLCCAVIHHGGLGTLATAAAAGIPQLVLASGADRPDNGARLKKLGIGDCIPLSQSSSESVVDALRGLLFSESHSICCEQIAARIHEHDTAASACAAVERFGLT